MTYTLILLRHGESEWNAKNLFTGWVDVPLTEKGRAEASRGGELLAAEGLEPDVLHTSLLKRAITTANLALEAADRQWIPVKRSWRLNERHYGGLTGLNKAETIARVGEEQVKIWRRSFDIPPPPLEGDSPYASLQHDRRYAGIAVPAVALTLGWRWVFVFGGLLALLAAVLVLGQKEGIVEPLLPTLLGVAILGGIGRFELKRTC